MTESSGLCLDPDIQKLMHIVARKKSHHLQALCSLCWLTMKQMRKGSWESVTGTLWSGKATGEEADGVLSSVQDEMFGET